MIDYLDIHRKMLPNSISLAFKGNVTFDLVDSLLKIIADKLEVIEQNVATKKKVYGALVECMQNVCMHIEDNKAATNADEYDTHSALIFIDTDDKVYQIVTANYIPQEKVEGLRNSLNEINSFTKEELKQLYNKILTNKTFSNKGGGGLGLIDIARRIDNKIEYVFQPVDEQFSFFSFKIKINRTLPSA